MKLSRKQLTASFFIVLIACSVINFFLYQDVGYYSKYFTNPNRIINSSYQNEYEEIFINKVAIPYYPEIWSKTPWNAFHLNISKIFENLHLHGIETIESIDFITPEPKDAKLKHIDWKNEISDHYITCRNLSLEWKYPIGIPSISINKTKEFNFIMNNEYNGSALRLSKEKDFTQLIDFDALCLIHSPGFNSDNTIFNKEHYYKLTFMWMGSYRCWENKYIDFLCDISLNTCSKQGILSHIIIYNKPTKIINIAFRLTGWGADAFSHFHIFVIPQFAMIYNILVDLKIESMKENNINNTYPIFYNITLITHISRQRDIKDWFFRQFGLIPMKSTMITSYMNVSIIPGKSWCKAKNDVHWSPLLISPHFIRYKNKYNGAITMYWKLLAQNTMLNIKPYISNMSIKRNLVLYMGRGNSFRRGVSNNQQVIDTINQFVKNNSHRFLFEFQHVKRIYNRDEEKQYFSSAALILGPHGGAFANINLMQPGSYVLEFINWWSDSVKLDKDKRDKFRPCYYALSVGGGLKYYYLKPEKFNFDRGQMEISIDKLLRILERIYSDMEMNKFE